MLLTIVLLRSNNQNLNQPQSREWRKKELKGNSVTMGITFRFFSTHVPLAASLLGLGLHFASRHDVICNCFVRRIIDFGRHGVFGRRLSLGTLRFLDNKLTNGDLLTTFRPPAKTSQTVNEPSNRRIINLTAH